MKYNSKSHTPRTSSKWLCKFIPNITCKRCLRAVSSVLKQPCLDPIRTMSSLTYIVVNPIRRGENPNGAAENKPKKAPPPEGMTLGMGAGLYDESSILLRYALGGSEESGVVQASSIRRPTPRPLNYPSTRFWGLIK